MTPALPKDLILLKGAHDSPEEGLCLLEAVAYVAGEPHTDHPACASPVIAEFGRTWNDSLDDSERQMLVPYVDRLVGTAAGDDVELLRSRMAVDWLAREYAPAWLRLAGLTSHAEALKGLAPLLTEEAAEAAGAVLSAAYSAAYSAARSAARSAPDSAADSAAYSAACSAADSAAYSAACSAAYSAACSAARSAAYSAARSAADSALAPTVKALQVSALRLLDRMIEAKDGAA